MIMPLASKIFTGYRAVGYVSNHVPLAIRYHKRHKDNYVVTCVGKSFHTYNCSKLGIVSVSDPHPDDITCIAVDGHKVFTGCGNVVRVFKRGKQVDLTLEGHTAPVHTLLPFGDHLISVDSRSNVKVWDIAATEEFERLYLDLTFDNSTFEVTSVLHPSTYLNKILFGSKQGGLQLWNIKTNNLIHRFEGWNAAVTALEQAPAVDVVAVGLADGQILVHNIKFDETVVKFRQDWGPVTAITFRTDGQPLMLTGSTVGHIALWDLEERRLKCQIREAHYASVTGMKCLPSEPLLVTSASDNSLKVWIFDLSDGGGRLLKQRAGHSAPPNRIRHYSHNGHNIISAGQDSTLRSFSTIHDSANKSLGRASFDKSQTKRSGLRKDKHMMSPIVDFCSESTRESDWDNIVAVHRGLSVSTTWSYQRSTMGQHKFCHERFTSGVEWKNATATCVSMTSCGNFVLIGYSTGHIDVYNLQSGLHRGSFGAKRAHKGSVRGVTTDALNQVTMSAAASEKHLKFWRFKTKQLLDKVKLRSCVAQMELHRESAMLAVSLDDFSMSVVDVDTRTVVREFHGHTSRISDLAFSADCRWLISSSMDGTVRTWDMPSGRLIDCFHVPSAVTSLSLSPTSDFLVTSHVDDLGLYLWSNMALYSYVSLPPLPVDYEPVTIDMPSTTRSEHDEEEDDMSVPTAMDTEFKSASQISDELVTLSLLPESRWRNLLNLDIIKKRNKPKEPPRAPKAAPFFLPTLPGLEMKFDLTQQNIGPQDGDTSASFMNATDFGRSLLSANDHDSYVQAFSKLTKLGPSAIDIEIRSLSLTGVDVTLMRKFITCIAEVLETNTNFEITQALLGLFLKIHGETIADDTSLKEDLRLLVDRQKSSWLRLQNLFDQSLCLVNYTRSSTL